LIADSGSTQFAGLLTPKDPRPPQALQTDFIVPGPPAIGITVWPLPSHPRHCAT